MNTSHVDKSKSGGTGPSAYGTGPTVINDLDQSQITVLRRLYLIIGYKTKYNHVMA